jgi:hypothetical protein
MTTLRRWWVTLVSAVVTAALLLLGVVVFLADSDQPHAQAAPPVPGAQPAAGRQSAALGPEAVPLTGGRALGPARAPTPGSARGGVPCGSREQLTYHVHARLTIFVNGKPRSIPLGIGIGAPVRVTRTARGPFASGGSCFSFLHTHAADGVIHIEAPGRVDFTLGQFFNVWKQRLDRGHIGPISGPVVAYVNGKRYRRDPRTIVLAKHAQITLEAGRHRIAPPSITFPPGL